jgi:acid phosphatase (class A)
MLYRLKKKERMFGSLSSSARTVAVCVLCIFGAMSAVSAADGPYLRADQLDVRVLLPTPPAEGSPELELELAKMHEIEAHRTPEQAAQAKADDAEESMFFFATVFGPKFNRKDLPMTSILSDRLRANEVAVNNPVKAAFARNRPNMEDSTLHPVCPGDTKAYISGHAMNGYVEGLALAAALPEYHDAIHKRMNEYAFNRLVCGVHYPADIEGSKRLAYAMTAIITSNPAYLRDFAAARAELRRAFPPPSKM